MLKNVLAALGLLSLLVVAGGALLTGAGRSLAELPLSQAVNLNLGRVGNVDGQGPVKPYVASLPPKTGFALTRISSPTAHSRPVPIAVTVNGLLTFAGLVGSSSSFRGAMTTAELNPPLIVAPGQTLVAGTNDPYTNGAEVTIGGYFLKRSDLGR